MLSGLTRLFGFRAHPIAVPAELWAAVEASLPCLAYLGAAEREDLRTLTQAFLADKVFSGAAGYEPDNFARLSIAMQACLPILKLGLDSYAGWRGIIVYPGDFVVPRRVVDEAGVLHEYEEDALGESWDGGPVILTWFADPADYDGANVVIHEFAHKLDMLCSPADGLPPLHAGMRVEDWHAAFAPAYEDFCARVDAGEPTALDPYAAEHPAEFFAVASEAFFTAPDGLFHAYPAVYRQLAAFYRQDPRKPIS